MLVVKCQRPIRIYILENYYTGHAPSSYMSSCIWCRCNSGIYDGDVNGGDFNVDDEALLLHDSSEEKDR
ncbi:hypothetical protein YC2023_057628 [Brassica napus]